MRLGASNYAFCRSSKQPSSTDSRADFCQKLLLLSTQVCSACMQASRQAPLQHLSSTSGPKSQILGVIPVRICLFWAPRSAEACMQAGRQAPLQNEAGTSPAPVVQERGGKKAIFERALRPETRGEGAENATSRNHQGEG